MRVAHDKAVLEELIEIAAFIAEKNEDSASKFIDACDNAFKFLAENPKAGAPKKFVDPALDDIRMWRIKDFEKYLGFYKPTINGILILHVIHSVREWRGLFDDEAR